MERKELFNVLKRRFGEILDEHDIRAESVNIRAKTLSPQEAIGDTVKKDYPILNGKEVMLEATYKGCRGQAFTAAPSDFSGTLEDVLRLDLDGDAHSTGLFIATLNAVTRYIGISDRTVHCRDDGPEKCAEKAVEYIRDMYGDVKIALVGYQPSLLEKLSQNFSLRVLDLNPENIGEIRYGVRVEDGNRDMDDVTDWAELILCTGSTVCNGTICAYLELDKEVLYFGTTLAGASAILGCKRMCFCAE